MVRCFVDWQKQQAVKGFELMPAWSFVRAYEDRQESDKNLRNDELRVDL
jgi:hypothetical protein